jgi:hypothetical protein
VPTGPERCRTAWADVDMRTAVTLAAMAFFAKGFMVFSKRLILESQN